MLADEEHGVGIDEGQDADALGALDHAVDGGTAVGQERHVLAHPDPAVLVDGACRARPPRLTRERMRTVGVGHGHSPLYHVLAHLSYNRAVAHLPRRNALMPLPALVEALWNDLQSVRARVLKEIEGLSQAQADWRTSDKDWSIGEIVHHLTLAEIGTGKVTSKVLKDAGRRSSLSPPSSRASRRWRRHPGAARRRPRRSGPSAASPSPSWWRT